MGTLVGEVPMQVGRKYGIPILALYAAPELQRSPVIGLGANHKHRNSNSGESVVHISAGF